MIIIFAITIKTLLSFLSQNWSYFTTFVLACWSIYTYSKARNLERKKSLQEAYFKLTAILNEFIVYCNNDLFSLSKTISAKIEFMESIAKMYEFMDAMKSDTKSETLITLARRHEEVTKKHRLERNDNPQITPENLYEIQQKLSDSQKRIEAGELMEQKLKNEILRIKEQVKEVGAFHEGVGAKAETFQAYASKEVRELSVNITKLRSDLKSTPFLQLIASKAVIEIILDIERACVQFQNLLFELENMSVDSLQRILKSAEFVRILFLCNSAIKKMRSEL